jgi:predicted ATP-dependent endonuclease of OLD family
MKIINLSVANVQRIQAVEIKPEGNTVIIGGKNAQGKTSVLDSIFMALGGKSALGDKPVRDGEKKASIILELDDYIVTRTITCTGGGTLKVEDKDGSRFSSPQKMLDNLCSSLSFDPLSFLRSRPAEQIDLLKQLVGVDFTDLDKERERVFTERTAINRQGKSEKARLDALPVHDDAPLIPVSVYDLVKEKDLIDAENNRHRELLSLHKTARESAKESEIEVERCRLALKKAINASEIAATELLNIKREVDLSELKETDSIVRKIDSAEKENGKLADNKKHRELSIRVDNLQAESSALTSRLKEIDVEKEKIMSKVNFPVDGLSFGEDGVTYQGRPLSVASGAEQLKISVGMGIALNPKLKVLLIRDGSLLDDENLSMISDLAESSGAQVWIERVGKGDECSVIIEDGLVETA